MSNGFKRVMILLGTSALLLMGVTSAPMARAAGGHDISGQGGPFVRMINDTTYESCSGTVIDDYKVLTAQHCFVKGRLNRVVVAPNDGESMNNYWSDAIHSNSFNVASVAYWHKKDLALVTLTEPLPGVQPAPVYNRDITELLDAPHNQLTFSVRQYGMRHQGDNGNHSTSMFYGDGWAEFSHPQCRGENLNLDCLRRESRGRSREDTKVVVHGIWMDHGDSGGGVTYKGQVIGDAYGRLHDNTGITLIDKDVYKWLGQNGVRLRPWIDRAPAPMKSPTVRPTPRPTTSNSNAKPRPRPTRPQATKSNQPPRRQYPNNPNRVKQPNPSKQPKLLRPSLSPRPRTARFVTPQVARVAGASRVETSVAAFSQVKNQRVAVLATGRDFPDGLVAGSLAGALKSGVVLTTSGGLEPVVLSALQAAGTRKVYIVGGSSVVPLAVEQDLRAAGITVERLAGADRYATSEAVNAKVLSLYGGGAAIGLYASGANYPDALAASGVAGRLGGVLNLVRPGSAVVADSVAKRHVCVGGPACVAANQGVERIVGQTRYETALQLSALAPTDKAILASGRDFPDALVAGGLAASLEADVVLYAGWDEVQVPEGTQDITILGGLSVVPYQLRYWCR